MYLICQLQVPAAFLPRWASNTDRLWRWGGGVFAELLWTPWEWEKYSFADGNRTKISMIFHPIVTIPTGLYLNELCDEIVQINGRKDKEMLEKIAGCTSCHDFLYRFVYGYMSCILLFNSVSYVILLLRLCILTVCTLRSVHSVSICEGHPFIQLTVTTKPPEPLSSPCWH